MRVFGKEFRIFKHDLHGPVPLMAQPCMRRVRRADIKLRGFISRHTKWEYHSPKYLRPQLTDEEYLEQHASIKRALGSNSPVPFVARYYREQSRLVMLDKADDQEKQELIGSGPLCTSEDEMYMQLSEEDRLEYLRQVAEDADHPDHEAVAAWVNGTPVPEVSRRWLISPRQILAPYNPPSTP